MEDNRSLFHQGQSTERNVNSASARVGFDDLDGTVSGFMQVLFPAAGGWNFFYTPKEGDQVVTSRLPNGAEEGYILGKVYTANKMPQGGAKDIFLMVSDDGKNVIKFDAANGTMDLICDQGSSIKCKSLAVEATEGVSVNAKTADINIENSANIKAKTANIEASDSAKVSSPKVIIESADAVITGGTLTTNGSVSPTGSGPYCAMVACALTGAPQVGNKVSET
jgi:phage baseplate assembly protein gpV